MVWYEDQKILFAESGLYLITVQHTGNLNAEKDNIWKKLHEMYHFMPRKYSIYIMAW